MTIIRQSIMKFDSNEELFGHKPDSQMLIWMKPSEFLDKSPKLSEKYWSSLRTRTVIKDLSDKMKKDIPIDPLFLDIDTVNCKVANHEGRHRAMAAKEVGIARVPVIIYLKDDKGDNISVKEYMKKGCACNLEKII